MRWCERFQRPSGNGSEETVASHLELAVKSLRCLTPREQEVLIRFLEFLDDKRVAHSLGISACTVRNQIASIMDKLSVESRLELIATIIFQSLRD